jgi:serine/threonine protein kinase
VSKPKLNTSISTIILSAILLAGSLTQFAKGQESDGKVHLTINSFPHSQVYLETSRGPSYLGLSGTKLLVEPPALLDAKGKFSQFGQGTLLLKKEGHEDLRVNVIAQDWTRSTLPKDGHYKLVALTTTTAALDYFQEYRWTSTALLLAIAAGTAWGVKSRSELRSRRLENSQLTAQLKVTGDPLIGKSLGEYLVVDQLGSGGMATVYKVKNADAFFAAKVIYMKSAGDENLQRFRREFKLMSSLNHPGLVRGFDYGEAEGVAYCVMELANGQGLDKHIVPEGLPWHQIWRWAKPIMEALTYAHDKGLVHRDLKPSNIMLTESGPKILDFGLARHSSVAALTATGNAFGTPSYIAPEQISAKGAEVEPRTDQYSLGIMLFEMLTGAPPFCSPEIQDIITMHITKAPPKVSSLRGDIPVGLDEIIAKMLAKLPAMRYESLRDVISACEALDLYAPPVSSQPNPQPQPGSPIAQSEATIAVVRKEATQTPKKADEPTMVVARKPPQPPV